MANAVFHLPQIHNEPVLSYVKGSPERNNLIEAIKECKGKSIDIPMYIGGKRVTTDQKVDIRPPHELRHLLGKYHKGTNVHVRQAIQAALRAKPAWEAMECMRPALRERGGQAPAGRCQ